MWRAHTLGLDRRPTTHQNKHNKHFTQKMYSFQEQRTSTDEKTAATLPLQPPPEEIYSRESELAMEVESLKKRLALTEKALAFHRRVKPGQAVRPKARRSTGQQWGSPFRVELPDEMWLAILGHLPITCLKEVSREGGVCPVGSSGRGSDGRLS